MDPRIDATATRAFPAAIPDEAFVTDRVKLIKPGNAAIIAGLALSSWVPVTVAAYLLAR